MAEKTYRVKVCRTPYQAAWVEVCTDINPETQDFLDMIDEESFQLEDFEWDTVEVGPIDPVLIVVK